MPAQVPQRETIVQTEQLTKVYGQGDTAVTALEGIKDWENGIIPPVSFSASDHLAQDSGFMVEVQKGIFRPISGWITLKNGVLTPLGQ